MSALVVSPHADDFTAFCGGTVAKLADAGWRVVVLRVTDDCRDSVGMSLPETRIANAREMREAAVALGVAAGDVVDLHYETDRLADVSQVALRERLVYWIRRVRPFAVFSFDPFVPDSNQDHVKVAEATEEALWAATFDLHHPEHFDEGLEPFSVCERWYYARDDARCDHVEDISEQLERKIAAISLQRTMMRNVVNQYRLQLKTMGRRMAMLDTAMDGELQPLLAPVLSSQAASVGRRFGMPPGRAGEVFRKVRFGDLEDFFMQMSEPIDQAIDQAIDPEIDSAIDAAEGYSSPPALVCEKPKPVTVQSP